MVFFGIPLPAKNQAIRMANLNIALQNDAIKLLSAATIISQNTKDHPEVVQAKLESLARTPAKTLAKIQAKDAEIINPEVKSYLNNLVDIVSNISPLQKELRAKLNSGPSMGLKPIAKVNLNIDTKESKVPAVSSGNSSPAKSETDATMSSETDLTIENILNDLVSKFNNPNFSLDDFRKILAEINKNKLRTKTGNKTVPFLYWGDKTGKNIDKGKVFNRDNFEADGQKTFDFIKSNPESYIQGVMQLHGAGLFKTKESLSSKRSPNFGNLWLNEKSLKKNTLSIMRPYSNIYEVSAKGISNLLKKMIIDISNTLEFDVKDYENLESDEKKIIERIINKQKDMKNYNIQSLIGDDINKSRKRLEILFGEINSGNNSSLVFDEALELLKSLYKNGFLSHTRYNNLRRTIKDMMT